MRAAALALLLAGAAQAGEAPRPFHGPHFVEEAREAGLEHVYGGGWEFFVGGGAAAFDCDGDRRPDLLLAGGANPARLFVNRSATGGPLRFEARPLDALGDELTGVLGAYPLDVDGDGLMDLAILRLGRNALLRGLGDCRFERADRAWRFDGGREWTAAFAATWEAGARFPTLAFGNYVDRSAPGAPWGTCAPHALHRPGPGEAPDYSTATELAPGQCALSLLFTDWGRLGRADLRAANDRQYHLDGEEQLWRVEPERAPRLFRRAEGWRRLKIWGMGIAEADLDADGYPEYALTSMGDTLLQQLDPEAEPGAPTYRDIAFARGATAHRPHVGGDLRPSTGWHAEFADFDNDGLLDLFIAKGNVEQMPDFAAFDPDSLLMGQWDGRFAEAGAQAGVALDRPGRGAAVADFNLDGMLDLLVVNREGATSLFRSLGAAPAEPPLPMGGWAMVALEQPAPNRTAVGAELSVRIGARTLRRVVQVGGGHASGHAGWIHLGLGVSERAEVRVRWPDGVWSHPYRLFAGQFAVIRRGAAAPAIWSPE